MRKIRESFKALADRARALNDVNAMSDLELGDIGMSRGHLGTIAGARAELPSQMQEMAKRFDLDPQDINYPRWRALEMIDACRNCSCAEGCFDYLVGDRQGSFKVSDCPNAKRYEAMSQQKA